MSNMHLNMNKNNKQKQKQKQKQHVKDITRNRVRELAMVMADDNGFWLLASGDG